LTSNQPAGSYFIQVQPSSGSGFYILTLREVVQTQPSVTTVVTPTSLSAGHGKFEQCTCRRLYQCRIHL
jgi:hypothetical protein